ncbi:nucleotide exchange factor GrpE, partial [Myxococcota bacterium]|nr:nucleotide exchange factor GrpE [Myxococcota bacterium]
QPLIQSNQSDHKNNSESDEMIKEAGKLIQKIALEIGFQEDHRDRSSIREKLNILVQKIEESSELNDQNEGLLITINQLKKFIERLSQENPLELLAQSVENNDLITAIHQFKNLYSAQTQGPISDDLIQSHLIGFTKSIWLISSDWVSSSHPIAEALRDCLKQINITLFFPKREESYQPHNHRVISRRAAREGEPLGRIIHVHAPGFKQNDNVIDKAEVIISD